MSIEHPPPKILFKVTTSPKAHKPSMRTRWKTSVVENCMRAWRGGRTNNPKFFNPWVKKWSVVKRISCASVFSWPQHFYVLWIFCHFHFFVQKAWGQKNQTPLRNLNVDWRKLFKRIHEMRYVDLLLRKLTKIRKPFSSPCACRTWENKEWCYVCMITPLIWNALVSFCFFCF